MKTIFNQNLQLRRDNQYQEQQSSTKQQTNGGFESFPIIVNDELYNDPLARHQTPLYYDYIKPIGLNENYPDTSNQQYSRHPENPSFILLSAKLKKKKKSQVIVSLPLTDERPQNAKLKNAPKMDVKLIKAVQQPNSNFVIDKFFLVSERTNDKLSLVESIPIKGSTFAKSSSRKGSQELHVLKQIMDEEETSTVKVESIGMTAADQPIPDYSGYFPQPVFRQAGSGEEATLILEPNSKAISGNDGTSISSPVSRAVLRKGTAVKVLFRPQSVAITGAHGIAHAQADLFLDFIEDE